MKPLNCIKLTLVLIFCATLTSCGDDDPIVCNTIEVHDGNDQAGIPGEAMASPIQVSVKDPSGQPVSNAQVNWEVVQGGGTVSTNTTNTNAQGIAEVNWVYGQEDGKVRATIQNHGDCTSNSVDFMASSAQFSLSQTGSSITPKRLRSNGSCYEYDYLIKYTSNLDLSQYYLDVKGEYQFASETKTTSFFKSGILDAANNTISFMDCFSFEGEAYVDDWLTVAVYKKSDVQDGKIVAGAMPLVISNRMGPIRTTKPDGAPRFDTSKSGPRVAQRGN
ncbi:Ig-like domain-containing protein [Pontibacter sp. HSC-14F20]|uniref:Ig-like domain-containing protein n=1 Tax=Pontibacter sp. HSC-14F20 TaxID=2864136 RepID=UPI001C736204|nr:Ig-like domain-containing protein [Pontibacter sp. HSC-14F20]MBX0333399.1 Ig-like domain-containing protein [Pontibacter sp. HSC-14F20]